VGKRILEFSYANALNQQTIDSWLIRGKCGLSYYY
jgi:hypothetical protein